MAAKSRSSKVNKKMRVPPKTDNQVQRPLLDAEIEAICAIRVKAVCDEMGCDMVATTIIRGSEIKSIINTFRKKR